MRFVITLVACLLFGGLSHAASKPNIVLILCDDLGFETLSCYGGTSYKTPNLDQLATTGAVFKRAYATPLCSPSRVELMTGRYGFRTSWTNLIGRGDDANDYFDPKREKTFGQLLKDAGYATVLAGKWQLADFSKHSNHVRECGFDEHCCWAWELDGKRTSRYWDPAIWQDGKLREDTKGKYGEDIFSDFLVDFITRHKSQPFFAYYPMCLVHEPHTPTPAARNGHGNASKSLKREAKAEKKQRKKAGDANNPVFEDMMSYTDRTVGKIIAALDRLDLRENTIIIFTGDNGTARTVTSVWNGQKARGGKGQMTEFGTHVPFIVNWKGTVAAGRAIDDLIDFSDVLPTLAALTGAKLPKDVTIDGHSFAPQLRGEKGKPREWIFSQLGKDQLVRDSQFMLHSNGELYDVEHDPFEQDNLSGKTRPEIIAAERELQKLLPKLK